MLRPLILLAAFLGLLSAAHAQTDPASSELRDYRIASWAGGDGVTLGAVRRMVQDEDGYIWVASDSGLVRFDGLRFVTSGLVEHVELPAAAVRALRRGRDGSLLVGYGGGRGVYRIAGGEVRATYLEGQINGFVNALAEDRAGALWIGHDQGLHRVVPGRGEPIALPGAGSDRRVFDVLEDRTGTLWVATAHGLYRRTAHDASLVPLDGDVVRSISEDPDGVVWVTDDTSGFRRADAPPHHALAGRGMTLFHDREGNLWVATIGQGLWKVQRGTAGDAAPVVSRATVDRGLLSDEMSGFLEDREGNIWAGANMGLHRLTRSRALSLVDLGIVRGVVTGPGDTAWIASTRGLVAVSSVRSGSQGTRQTVSPAAVRTLHRAPDGTLWVATTDGLHRLAGRQLVRAPSGAKPLTRITSIVSDRRGGLWVCDELQGVVRIASGRVEHVDVGPSASNARPTLIYMDREDGLWTAFGDGTLRRIAAGGRREYGPADGLSLRTIYTLHQDITGRLWVGGDGGLSTLTGERFLTLDSARGLPAPPIAEVIDDDAGDLWVGIWFFGFIRLSRDELTRAIEEPGFRLHYPVYNTAAGTAGLPDRLNSVSAAKDSGGRLWFVTSRGLTIVDPRMLRDEEGLVPSPPRIETVMADEQRYRPAAGLALPARVNRLSIDYAVINVSSFDQTRFRYRLDGFDTGWIDGTGRRQATYTNLAPRQYTFRLQSSTAASRWEDREVEWAFSIAPAFYQTPWFRALSVLALGLAIAGAWRLRMRQVHKRLAAVLNERIRLSRELHDTLLQSLVGVALQLDVASSAGGMSASARSALLRMRRQVEGYIREARQSIWELRSPTRDSLDIVAALRDMGSRLTADHVAFDLSVTGTRRTCDSKVQTQVLRVAQEALTNVVRHADARKVSVEVSFAERSLRLRIADDGRGFNPETSPSASGHYGLLGMRERAADVGGHCAIQSTPGSGTSVEAEFPLAS
jgi:signal transduction histidine kinase/ligand-binding sensor domain-containing protein